MIDVICLAKDRNPALRKVTVSPEQHLELCREMAQREGIPIRVYCLAGVKIEVA